MEEADFCHELLHMKEKNSFGPEVSEDVGASCMLTLRSREITYSPEMS